MNNLSYPKTRLRRNRKADWSRSLVAESSIRKEDLIWPIFVQEGYKKQEEIKSMPGVYRYTADLVLKKVEEAKYLGINAVMLFPYTPNNLRTKDGKEAYNENNLICKIIRDIKHYISDMGVITDVALDPYTSHGQDGIVDANGNVINDKTVEVLCKQALVLANAGCDAIAPSDMMDGRIGVIRNALEKCGFIDVQIMAYSAKYASNFYSPFRDAVGSKNLLGDANKKTYQIDCRNIKEAMTEIALDISEGADIIIIKPGMPYLDVIHSASSKFDIPIIAYQVSGEYSMLKNNSQIFDEKEIFFESLISFKRAGANAIITYAALEIVKHID